MLEKILNISTILRVKFGPAFNRWLFRKKGIIYGKNMTVMGKVSVIGSGSISIGDNFMLTSGEHINPISSNHQASFLTDTPNARIRIGNNVGMSSCRIWIHEGLNIGNNGLEFIYYSICIVNDGSEFIFSLCMLFYQ